MPPRTRANKPAKGLKENIGIVLKTKVISTGKVMKPARKALGDKTNSASDDNASVEIPKKLTKKPTETAKENYERPRRDRRLPNRFVQNEVLKNLCNSKDTFTPEGIIIKTHTLTKSIVSINSSTASSFKTPQKCAETSLVTNRPRRICRLPSKFEDHSVSPNRFVPVQPIHASTPKLQKIGLKLNENKKKENSDLNVVQNNSKERVEKVSKISDAVVNKCKNTLQPAKPKTGFEKNISVKKAREPINKPATQGRTLRGRKVEVTNCSNKTKERTTKTINSLEGSGNNFLKTVSTKKASPVFSFRVLEDRNSSKENKNPDIYEFTYDPKDEPPPQKKKKRRVVKKKLLKPKTVVFKNNYDQNLSKAMAALKSAIAKKPVAIQTKINKEKNPNSQIVNNQKTIQISANTNTQCVTNTVITERIPTTTIVVSKCPERNKSVQIEDIAADFEISFDHHDLNYSPVNSPDPNHPQAPVQPPSLHTSPTHNNDPLNLRDNLSFFDDQPVANSSMNMSVRHPQASPWRIEFDSLPIKWHTNSYVKPNMTPAVESSFVNFEDSKKKHVYTNMVPQSDESLPHIVEKNTPNFVQPSIMSFIKEVVERNANKKQRPRPETSTACIFSKANCNKEIDNLPNQTRQTITPMKSTMDKAITKNTPNTSNESDNSTTLNKENSRESLKRKNDSGLVEIPAKTPRKDNDNYFGFDESEVDQENVSPSKNINVQKRRALRLNARAVLREINEQGPTRALLPLAVKSKDSERVNRLYEEMKSATDAPIFPEKDALQTELVVEATNIDLVDNDDSQSVHLFEDIEFVHHLNVSICKIFLNYFLWIFSVAFRLNIVCVFFVTLFYLRSAAKP